MVKEISNDDNIAFYNGMEEERFRGFSQILGMDAGNDISAIYPQIKEAEVLVELGSGYGRVINNLLQRGYQNKLIAIEVVKPFVEILKRKFTGKVEIVHQNIKTLQLEVKADAILWMWSGILELPVKEQLRAVQWSYEHLKEGGKLIIEIPYQKIHYIGQMSEQKLVKVETEWGVLHAYLTNGEEITQYAQACGFKTVEEIVYKTGKDVERAIYVLEK